MSHSLTSYTISSVKGEGNRLGGGGEGGARDRVDDSIC